MSYTLTEKGTPADTDEVVIKDSEDAGAVKCIQLANMPKGSVEILIPVAGYPAIIGGNQTGYLCILGGTLGISGIENYNQVQMPACSVKAINGYCHDASSDLTLTIRKEGGDTAITGTLTATGEFRISGGPIAFAKGDLLSISFDCDVGGGNAISSVVVEADVEAT